MFKRLQHGRREKASIYWKSIEDGPFLLQYVPRRSSVAHVPEPAQSQRASREQVPFTNTLQDHDPSRDAFHEHGLSGGVFYDHTSSTQPLYGPVDPRGPCLRDKLLFMMYMSRLREQPRQQQREQPRQQQREQ
ncbi:hypothetical protein C2S52_010122 [Perilla frutescens var. hirtella]|nr:hypothetical protein C2S52_010122 [Perilla frutescens var. hirtella]KAH6816970.1 hypothetical protein C2S51_000573 [Perilla frutescens var. frutescens]